VKLSTLFIGKVFDRKQKAMLSKLQLCSSDAHVGTFKEYIVECFEVSMFNEVSAYSVFKNHTLPRNWWFRVRVIFQLWSVRVIFQLWSVRVIFQLWSVRVWFFIHFSLVMQGMNLVRADLINKQSSSISALLWFHEGTVYCRFPCFQTDPETV